MLKQEKNIVVIDDEKYVCNIIMEALAEFEDFHIHKFTDPDRALEFIDNHGIDLVLTDLVMGDYSGVQILDATQTNHPDAVVILMTGYPTVKTAISVLKKGAYDYLIKPFKLEDLKSTIKRGLEHQRVKRENVALRSQLELMKINEAFTRGEKLHLLLHQIADSIVGELNADAASLVLLDRKSGQYRLRYLSGDSSDADLNDFLYGRGPYSALAYDRDISHIFNDEIERDGKTLKRSFVIYPLIAKGRNIGFLNLVCVDRFSYISPGQKHLVSLLASSAASAVESNYMDKNLQKSYLMTIKALANAVEARDYYTAGHTDRVYRLAKITARKLGWSSDKLVELRNGCILHDIGKIGVPDAILNKPGRLTDNEMAIMRKHPEMGARILKGIPFLSTVIPYTLSHHERYDGTGYPYGLAGEDIPIEGRLLAVVDTYDAIMSDRPYRPCADSETAISELKKYKAIQFDPLVVEAFLEAYHENQCKFSTIYRGCSSSKSAPFTKMKMERV
nr:response regulator [candidate division Zixibacteria bacterium]